VILWLLVAGALFRPNPARDLQVTNVSLISSAQFSAMQSSAPAVEQIGHGHFPPHHAFASDLGRMGRQNRANIGVIEKPGQVCGAKADFRGTLDRPLDGATAGF